MVFDVDLWPSGVVALIPWHYITSHGGHSPRGLGGFICIAAYIILGPNLIANSSCACCLCRYMGLSFRTIETRFLPCDYILDLSPFGNPQVGFKSYTPC